jgi:hypothetical protein
MLPKMILVLLAEIYILGNRWQPYHRNFKILTTLDPPSGSSKVTLSYSIAKKAMSPKIIPLGMIKISIHK